VKEKHNQLLVQMDIIYYKHHVKLVTQRKNVQVLVKLLDITPKELESMLPVLLVLLVQVLVLMIKMLQHAIQDIIYKESFVLLSHLDL